MAELPLPWKAGRLNLLTDVAGLAVGNATDAVLKSGATAVIADGAATASVHVVGGAPGTRETDLLDPERTVEGVDAVVLSGGSAFGLEAASGTMEYLAETGRGFAIGPARIPIVSSAILFDLLVGEKPVAPGARYRALGREAAISAGETFALGSVGAGAGATTCNLKGGLGSASAVLATGHVVAALIATNPIGQLTIGETGHFWAAPFEIGDEFGGRGMPHPFPADATALRHKLQAADRANTAIAVVATDAVRTKAQAKRMAVAAMTGVARAIWPSHTAMDGDTVFALATGRNTAEVDVLELESATAAVMARAAARAVFHAEAAPGDVLPCWQDRFG